MKDQKFFLCKHCGNILGLINDAGVPVDCCGEKMTELVANTSDGAQEKHVPVVKYDGNTVHVNVGSVDHPMLEEHHIAWIYLQTNKGGQRKALEVGAKPEAVFALTEDEKPLTVFEYCNLHGLWKADVK